MKQLFLEDLKDRNNSEVRNHIVSSFAIDECAIKDFDVLVAYESVGSWGCDSNSWYLLRKKGTKKLFEVSGSHCSCFGFEGQWSPSPRASST